MAIRRQKKKKDETLVDLVEARGQAQDFLEHNQNYILGALVGLVVIIGGVFAYNNFYMKPRQQQAVQQIYQAERQFERDSFAMALENPGGGNDGFLAIIDKYGSTKAGNLAEFYAGVCWLNLGEYDAAIEHLKSFKPTGTVTPAMKASALGDAYAEQGNAGNALKFYKKAAEQSKDEVTGPYALKKLALFCEDQGDLGAAKKYYEQIKERFPKSRDAQDVDKYISRVAGK